MSSLKFFRAFGDRVFFGVVSSGFVEWLFKVFGGVYRQVRSLWVNIGAPDGLTLDER